MRGHIGERFRLRRTGDDALRALGRQRRRAVNLSTAGMSVVLFRGDNRHPVGGRSLLSGTPPR